MMDSTLTAVIGILLGCLLALSWFAGTDAPYVPSDASKIRKLLKSLKFKKGAIFYELGSGDGRVVQEAAKLGLDSYGIEQSWLRVWYSRINSQKLKLSKNTHFYHGNIFDRSYYPADIVFIYLLQDAVNKLEPKLKKELNKGSVVITQTFHFKNWKPFKKELMKTKEDKIGGEFYLYKV